MATWFFTGPHTWCPPYTRNGGPFRFFLFLVLFPSYREKKEKTFDSCRSSYNIYHATPNLLVVVIISWNDANNTHTQPGSICVVYVGFKGRVCCTHLIVSDSCVLVCVYRLLIVIVTRTKSESKVPLLYHVSSSAVCPGLNHDNVFLFFCCCREI